MRPATLLLALAAALVAAGCGGSGDTALTAPKASNEEAVIRNWADDLRRGDVAAASAHFALPATVANGSPATQLRTRAEVAAFNRSLPCGAKLIGTRRHYGVVIAEFRLTDRPGGDCGSGAGGTASTAFEIRKGRIVRWLRVPEGDTPPPVGEVI